MVQRLALRVAYDGVPFHGSQRQPALRTVEGELLEALRRVGAGPDARTLGFAMASRTDRGVSAAGNVVAVDTGFRPEALGPALNAHLRDAWITGWAVVPPGFRPRHAASRTYRYHVIPEPDLDVPAFVATLSCFEGLHDLSAFARVDPPQDPVRVVDRVEVAERDGLLEVDVTARSFLWHQVRRMVGAALLVARGGASLQDVEAALDGQEPRRGFPPAPPEPLVLVRVVHDGVAFAPVPTPRLQAALDATRVRRRVLTSALDAAAEDPSTGNHLGTP